MSGYFTAPRVREAEIEKYFARLEPDVPTLIAGDFNEGGGGRALEFLSGRGFRSALGEFADTRNTWRWHTSLGTMARDA